MPTPSSCASLPGEKKTMLPQGVLPFANVTTFCPSALKIELLKELEKYEGFAALKKLRIDNPNLQNFKGLSGLTNLQSLSIDVAFLENLQGLENLPALSHLDVVANNLKSLEGLKKLQHLKSLLVEVSSLSNMNGLKDCRNLSRIVIKALNLFSIKGMQNLPALEDLHIISFDLPDTVSDLANLLTLKKLSITSRISNVEKIKRLTQLKELSIISDNNGFYKAYQNWVRESCCNEFASETKHRFDSDTDDSDDSEIEDDYDDTIDPHDHCGKGLSWWDFFIKKDLHSFLTNDKNCKTYEGTIDDLTDDLCRKNTIISLKRP